MMALTQQSEHSDLCKLVLNLDYCKIPAPRSLKKFTVLVFSDNYRYHCLTSGFSPGLGGLHFSLRILNHRIV